MSFFVQTGPTARGRLSEALGSSIGQGIGESIAQGQQRQIKQQQGGILSKFFADTATPEEVAKLDPEIRIEAEKIKGKAPAGGLGGQPVPKEISQAIPRILNENKGASADELAVKFDEAGIPRAYSNSYIENRRRQDEQASQSKLKGEEVSRKEKIEFHKENAKYDESLTNKAESAERKIKAIKNQQRIQPNISNWDRWVSALFGGTRFEDIFKARSAQEFDSLALPMIEGQKENFGVRLSDADLRLIMQKIATSTKNPEANKTIMDWQLLESELDIEKRKIADEVKKENGGLRPLNFDSEVRKLMNERFGDKIQAKADEIMALEDDPAAVARIVGRQEVPKGTPINNQAIDMYLDMTGNDIGKAKELAIEDGYAF